MRVVRTIAVSVFRESVRDKVLYNLVFFAVLLIGVSYLLSQLTAGQDVKIIKDLGLVAMSVFGLFIAVFIGIGLVSKEVEKRSIYALLAKPIRARSSSSANTCGLVFTLLVNLVIMTVAYYAVLGARGLARRRVVPAAMERAGRRSRAAEGDRDDLPAAGDRDRGGALLLDVFQPDALGRADVRSVRRRAISTRT